MSTSPQRRPFFLMVAMALVIALVGSTSSFVASQDSLIPTDAPVDIHSGTCADIVAEPAYSGGRVELTTTDDMWNDDTFQTGIFEDDQLQASGVDFNNDGMLQEEEVITPHGLSVEMGHAEGDLGTDVATDEPYVVVVHASEDAYDTYLACGTIDGSQTVDGDRNLIYLQPVGESSIFGYAVLEGNTLNTYVFQPNTEPLEATAATDELEFVGHPVEIHAGVCDDFTSAPAYDIGDFQQTNVYAAGEQEAGDMEGDVPAEAQNLGPVYKLDAQDADFGDENILDQGPHVVAVHESAEEFGNVIACGPILDVRDGDDVVVFLHPMGVGNQVGYVQMNPDGGDANGFLWEIADFQQPEADSTPVPQATPAPIEREEPEATPTDEATAVIVETEVVPAATATAMAEEEDEAAAEDGTPAADEAEGEAEAAQAIEVGGDTATDLTVAANSALTVSNTGDNERTFSVPDLDLNATVGGGEQTELMIPENAEPGTYAYQVLEGDDVVFEGELTIE